MGRRSAAETIIAILTAFIERSSWRQASLAREVGITSAQLRTRLNELARLGVPLEVEDEPPHKLWSVPLTWFPGGVTLVAHDAQELLRQLARAPVSAERDRLLVVVASASRTSPPAGVATSFSSPHDENHLRLVEDGLAQRTCLRVRYTSASQGVTRERRLSVQRIVAGPIPRFVAHCHEAGELRHFRVSRISSAHLDHHTPYVESSAEEINTLITSSVDGYRDPIEPIHVSFVVREPELRWVVDTTPIPMHTAPIAGGLRFSATTSGVRVLARFVVGLGEAARAETPELLAAVHDLAQGALAANSPPIRSVAAIPSTDYQSDVP